MQEPATPQFCVIRHCSRPEPLLSVVQDDTAVQALQEEPELLDVLCSSVPTVHWARLLPDESSLQVEAATQSLHVLPEFDEVLL